MFLPLPSLFGGCHVTKELSGEWELSDDQIGEKMKKKRHHVIWFITKHLKEH